MNWVWRRIIYRDISYKAIEGPRVISSTDQVKPYPIETRVETKTMRYRVFFPKGDE